VGLAQFSETKILLIEDEAFIRSTVKYMFRSLGRPEVQEASDGSEALALLTSGYEPSIVLCDVHMQPMGGLAFIQELRALNLPALVELPVVMLTSASDRETVTAALAYPPVDYILKPVSAQLLSDRMVAILAQAAARRAWAGFKTSN
jgi:two-component system chemotaxis response regulator CheY